MAEREGREVTCYAQRVQRNFSTRRESRLSLHRYHRHTDFTTTKTTTAIEFVARRLTSHTSANPKAQYTSRCPLLLRVVHFLAMTQVMQKTASTTSRDRVRAHRRSSNENLESTIPEHPTPLVLHLSAHPHTSHHKGTKRKLHPETGSCEDPDEEKAHRKRLKTSDHPHGAFCIKRATDSFVRSDNGTHQAQVMVKCH